MDRIQTTNDGALGGNRDTGANPMAGMPPGRFGDWRVSVTPGASPARLGRGHQPGSGVASAVKLPVIRSRTVTEAPSSSGLSGATAMPQIRIHRTVAARSTPMDCRPPQGPGGTQWPTVAKVGPATDTPGTSSTAAAAGGVRARPGTLPEPCPKPAYRSNWDRFVRWCKKHDREYWPASPETVAEYLKERAERISLSTMDHSLSSIKRTLVLAGFKDRYTTGVVKSTLEELAAAKGGRRCRSKKVSGSSLDAADIDSIRVAALEPRRRGAGFESREDAMRRCQVDHALCSLALEAGLQCEQVAALEWQDLEVEYNGGPAITFRTGSAGASHVIGISERAYGDLEAIRPKSEEERGRIFPMSAQQVAVRIRAAARAAGLESRIAAPTSRHAVHGATASTSPPKVFAPSSYWRTFCAWCEERGEERLPAQPETVAVYLREVSRTRSMSTIVNIRYAIRDAHHAAGQGDPCATVLVEAAIREIRGPLSLFTPKTLDADALEAIRQVALTPRKSSRGQRFPEVTRKRRLVDIALCSLLHVARLTVAQLVALKWQDVENLGADRARLAVTSSTGPRGIAEFREIAGEVVRDLEAIRGDARPEDSVFGISSSSIYYRIRAAARSAGLQVPSESSPSHAATPGPSRTSTEGPPRTSQ